ncbi:hypothetical protein POTOM_049563 [Populus tomentosa]|uniref:EF-hand domain-containing protein n=1 Tax=Populus tomentosa TaxID=118781 RepID=A0A8X7YE71_POPTO|nr:hypothetical protein POTOM_049563 [Populus tomentosa]
MVNAREFEVVFRHLDENGDGKVSPSELSRRLGFISGEFLVKEAELAVESLDSDGDGLLGLEDLVRLMEAGGEEERLHDLREAFRLYDIDNCGFIRAKDLKTMLGRLGESRSIDECEVMINKFDLNGDGVLSFEEFMPGLFLDRGQQSPEMPAKKPTVVHQSALSMHLFQRISVSVNETLKSDTSNGTYKVSMRSSSEESLVIADDQLVENSLDADQSSIACFPRQISVASMFQSSSAASPVKKSQNIVLGLGLQAAYINKSYFHFVADNFYECQASLGSDSDDDFFSVKDGFDPLQFFDINIQVIAMLRAAKAA